MTLQSITLIGIDIQQVERSCANVQMCALREGSQLTNTSNCTTLM